MSTIMRTYRVHTGTNGCYAFDLDDTLTSKTSVEPMPGVVRKLKQLVADGYNIIVFSNQKATGQGGIGDPKLLIKLKKATVGLDVPISIYCARVEDDYRKPGIKMLDLVPKKLGKIRLFVGDAAGRPGDHSDCDLKFAESAGIDFTVPEEFFAAGIILYQPLVDHTLVTVLSVIILIGYPGSGKSKYYTDHLSSSVHISRDELKTMSKCEKLCESSLKLNKDVVIDNLNHTIESRVSFIALGRKYHANIVAIHISRSMGQSMEWNSTREKPVPKIVYYSYKKMYQHPTLEEGFDEIYTVL